MGPGIFSREDRRAAPEPPLLDSAPAPRRGPVLPGDCRGAGLLGDDRRHAPEPLAAPGRPLPVERAGTALPARDPRTVGAAGGGVAPARGPDHLRPPARQAVLRPALA